VRFEPTPEQEAIHKTARAFADRELAPRAAARDRSGEFPERELRALGGLGLLGVAIPDELGGAGADAPSLALAMMEIARADASVAVAMSVTNMVAEVIARFGTEVQKRRFVQALASGEALCGSFALSEPQSGSDAAAMQTTARRVPGGWVVEGAKQWITSGDRAGVIVLWARTDPAVGRGISAFIVDCLNGRPRGLGVGKHEEKMGLRGSTTVPLILSGLELGEDALLGQVGEGFKVAMAALDGGRIGIGAQAVGVSSAALQAARSYSLARVQFGVPIAQHQAIQFQIADMATEIEAARGLVLRAAWLKAQGRPFSREAAMAKLFASEHAVRVCDRAIQIHGGYGYTREMPVERYLRDVRVTTIYEGTSEIQRIVIARSLVGKGA
jgi:alkylation response protein AidB-like acyl-CoA dehydrogenase